MSRVRPSVSFRRLVLAAAAFATTGLLLAGCASEAAAPSSAPPTAGPTPAPTATPLPGLPLAAGYRPEGDWTVAFSRPGDIVREVYSIVLTCPDGACDAIVRVKDPDGETIAKGTFAFERDRYRFTSSTTRTVDCDAAGRAVNRGATERVDTDLVLAVYRLEGTAREEPGIRGERLVTIEPEPGSGCVSSITVYPAAGAQDGR